MKRSREMHNRARRCARRRQSRTDKGSVASHLAKPGGVVRKTLRTKRKEVARKEPGAKRETSAIKSRHSQSGNETVSRYIYRSLRKDEIRILVLQPGLRDQPLECMLNHSKLCDLIGSEYKALSYTWGSEDLSETITLCSHKFGITQNLFDALLELRQQNIETVLWIDALSINQCDMTERKHQVQLMSKIYERAKEVIAWLGPVTEDEEPGLNLLVTPGTSNVERMLNLLESSVPKAINLLVSRSYWYRAWVVQEIAFARSVRIQCGKYSMSFEMLQQTLEMQSSGVSVILTPGKPSPCIISPPSFPKRLLAPRSASSETSKGILSGFFLDSLLDRESTDPRDSVFAFYNLFPETLRKRITLDYKLKPKVVLLQAISAIIRDTQDLSAVTVRSRQKVPLGEAHIWQQDMPSWCPYVSTSFETDSLAAWHSPPYLDLSNLKISVDLSKRYVHARGFTLGTISEMFHYEEPLVDGDKPEFSKSESHGILDYYCMWKGYGLSIPKDDGRLESSLRISHISSAPQSKSESIDMEHLSEAVRYYRWMWRRRVCKVKTANWGAFSTIAVVPVTARGRDKICWIIGCPSALVLRISKPERNQGQLYKVVGEAYIKDVYEVVDKFRRERFTLH